MTDLALLPVAVSGKVWIRSYLRFSTFGDLRAILKAKLIQVKMDQVSTSSYAQLMIRADLVVFHPISIPPHCAITSSRFEHS